MKGGGAEKKAAAELPGSVSCQRPDTSPGATPLRRPSPAPAGGRAPRGHCLARVPTYGSDRGHHPCARIRGAPGRKAEKLGEDLASRTSSNAPLTHRRRKGRRGASARLGWMDALGVRGVPCAAVEGRWPFAPGLGMEKARPRPGASFISGLPGGGVRCGPPFPTLRAPTTTGYGPRTKISLPPDRSPGTGDPDWGPSRIVPAPALPVGARAGSLRAAPGSPAAARLGDRGASSRRGRARRRLHDLKLHRELQGQPRWRRRRPRRGLLLLPPPPPPPPPLHHGGGPGGIQT